MKPWVMRYAKHWAMLMLLVMLSACGKMGPVQAPPDSPPFPQTYPRY